jgi:hypothetical protein
MAPNVDAGGRAGRDASLAMFACGLMTGVALTLLFAPVSGRDTRHWIASTSGETRRRTAALIERNRQALNLIRTRGIVGLARRLKGSTGAPRPAGSSQGEGVRSTRA